MEQVQSATRSVFEVIEDYGHEEIVFCNDSKVGLKAIIAIHNTVLGPALGGVRMWDYPSEEAALTDVLRLSRGMTLKAAAAGLNLGGGKAVIIANKETLKNKEMLFRRFGQFVHSLGGRYITAEDVNVGVKEVAYIRMETPYVTGIPRSMGGSGDPSPFTAYGVYLAMKALLKEEEGNESLRGKRVVIKGVGKVGSSLAELLHKEGAVLYLYDIDKARAEAVAKKVNAEVLQNEEEAYTTPCDIYAPCALGAGLNARTIPMLQCHIIAGAANNQLEDEERDAQLLKERGILYGPDFLINAGGLINVATELEGYNEQRSREQIEKIYDHTLEVVRKAKEEGITTHEAAVQWAQQRIANIGYLKQYNL